MAIAQIETVEVIQDIEQAIPVLSNVSRWMLESGMNPSRWWHPDNMNKTFLLKYAEPEEFYVALVDGKPAAVEVLQWDQRNQDWGRVDKEESPPALYIYWLCVDREFAGQDLPKVMVSFAEEVAISRNVSLVRVDTNASEMRLREIYEDLDFQLVATEQDNYRATAFYQRSC
jgi:GNAT superfamily N-acetyltransferase